MKRNSEKTILRSTRTRQMRNEPKLLSISFGNFKPFSDKAINKLPLKPITLLYGWNNSGKSSILELIQLISKINYPISPLYQLPQNNNFAIFNANELTGLGSYQNYIHGNITNNNFKISYELQSFDPGHILYSTWRENKPLINSLTNSKAELKLSYSSSNKNDEPDLAILQDFQVDLHNFFSISASKRDKDNTNYEVVDMDFKKINSDNFFELISNNRSKIAKFLESIGSEIYNSDIDFNNKFSIGQSIARYLKRLRKELKSNLALLQELAEIGVIRSSIINKDHYYGEDINWDPDIIPKNVNLDRFLYEMYGIRQYDDILEAIDLITEILSTKSLETDSIISKIETIFDFLETELINESKYQELLISVACPNGNEISVEKLDNNFWEKYTALLPNNFQKGFLTKGFLFNNQNSEKKITESEIKNNREIVSKFLLIEYKFIKLRNLLKKSIDETKQANKNIKNIFPYKKDFISISGKFDDIDTPLIKIDIEEYEEFTSLLEKWNGKKGKTQDKLKELFFLSLKKSFILNSQFSSYPGIREQNSCLTLSSFIIALIKDDAKLQNDDFYFIIDNISNIVSALIKSARRSFRSNTFVHPNDSIHRLYEKKTLENIRSVYDLEYNFENVFNILRSNSQVRKKVNQTIKKMGFDFEINFKLIEGLNSETLFYPLAQNTDNSEINTSIADIGLGLKKIIPLITFLYFQRWMGVICIQEPESNLHPKYQSEMAEVLFDSYSSNGNFHIVETHSEILVLRLLKLIKQKKLNAEDVSINFIQKTSGESKIINIGVNDKGEFIDKWPNGFFKERINELL